MNFAQTAWAVLRLQSLTFDLKMLMFSESLICLDK